MTSSSSCPCGRNRLYSVCCGPLLLRTRQAATAEQLMRSRYTAFYIGDVDYLVDTLHPSQRKPEDRAALQSTIGRQAWLGLHVIDTRRGGRTDDIGYVEFAAYYGGAEQGQIHERSKFVKEEGQWFYWGGEQKTPIQTGRNDPCWCGSRKKYKRCHGA